MYVPHPNRRLPDQFIYQCIWRFIKILSFTLIKHSKTLIHFFSFCYVVYAPLGIHAQVKKEAVPEINSYTHEDFKPITQTWGISQEVVDYWNMTVKTGKDLRFRIIRL